MFRPYIRAVSLLFLSLILMMPPVSAQEQAAIQATATVTTSLSINGTQNLRFGIVSPGISKSVDKSTIGEAGEWQIIGSVGAEISLTFTLPDSLQHQTMPFGMNIAFGAVDGSYDDGTAGGQGSPAGILNPNAAGAERLGAATGSMTVWIGGTVFPAISQSGGSYAADVMLTVAYTGS